MNLFSNTEEKWFNHSIKQYPLVDLGILIFVNFISLLSTKNVSFESSIHYYLVNLSNLTLSKKSFERCLLKTSYLKILR